MGKKLCDLRSELNLFKRLVQVISATLDINQLLNLMIDLILNSVQGEVGIILLKDRERFLTRASLGLNEKILKSISVNKQDLLSWLLEKKKSVLVSNIMEDERFVYPPQSGTKIHSLISVPVIVKEKKIGQLILANKSADSDSAHFTKNDSGIIENIVSQVAVVIENARLYEEIINLKNYNDSILNSIASGVVTTDLKGRIITINRNAEFILGVTADHYLGKRIDELFKYVRDEQFDILGYITSGENIINYEVSMEKESGEILVLGVSISVLKNTVNRIIGTVINLEDYTNRKLMESQFRRAEQLAALGEMSAGVAHEIKNPLTSIRGFTQLLPGKLDDPEFLKKYEETVSREVNRLNMIVERFLTFVRPSVSGFGECNVNDILLNTLSLLHYQIDKKGIEVDKKLMDIPQITGDWRQLEQVFINLILNAVQMMEHDPKILTVISGTLLRRMMDNQYREFVCIKVRDNGPGIPADRKDKIFNPFFTTRLKGTGLGLSITNQIVEEHKGIIEVTSRMDEGSEFMILLPVAHSKERQI